MVIPESARAYWPSIAYGATWAGIKTLFPIATDMINHLISAEADHQFFVCQIKLDAYLRQMFSIFLSLHRRYIIIRLKIKKKDDITRKESNI